jgi:hypothetical protein
MAEIFGGPQRGSPWSGVSPGHQPSMRSLVDVRAQILRSWVETLEGEGLSVPLDPIRGAIETAKRTADSKRAQKLVERTSRLLSQTQRRWGTVRDLLKKSEQVRANAHQAGIDTVAFDQQIAGVQASIRTGRLSEALFTASETKISAAIQALELENSSPDPNPTQPAEDLSAHRAVLTSVSGGSAGLRNILVSYLDRGEMERAANGTRPCPGCRAAMNGSYCRNCRMVWID